MHKYDVAGQPLGLVQIMRRHHHLDAATDDGADDIFDGLGRSRIEACSRFVEQENLRLFGKRARERKPLLLAAGELACRTLAEPIEAHERTEFAGARITLRARHAGGRQRMTDVAGGTATKNHRALENDGPMRRPPLLSAAPSP